MVLTFYLTVIYLVEASKQLDAQSEERKYNHKEILDDLIEIQKQATQIFSRIGNYFCIFFY